MKTLMLMTGCGVMLVLMLLSHPVYAPVILLA